MYKLAIYVIWIIRELCCNPIGIANSQMWVLIDVNMPVIETSDVLNWAYLSEHLSVGLHWQRNKNTCTKLDSIL
jgi:hypothetical protein